LLLRLNRKGFLWVSREPVEICRKESGHFVRNHFISTGKTSFREPAAFGPSLGVRGLLVIKSMAR
jgi:hypothetical protein